MFTRMIGATKLAVAGAALLGLSACAGFQLENAKGLSPSGDAFSAALYKEYILLSEMEFAEGDYADSDEFAARAVASANGNPPAPEELSARNLPGAAQGELAEARRMLTEALAAGAGAANPEAAAMAQGGFDCWMQEQEENFQPKDIMWCKDRFKAAMAKLTVPAPKAEAPKPAITFANFTVYFDFDKSSLTPETQSTLIDAANAADDMGAGSITVSGYADRSGPAAYNMKLSQRRAEAVATELTTLIGANAPAMTLQAFGETQNKVVTPDGVKEAKNRRVKIEIRK
ncbi:membrane protein [Thalassobaculum fulvum]|jgi:outer membrane protein OmpA-like peptidoglycan-associated protein|uniref:Membrane protein n=1 Tax=Thalassobaculum fulvum TaxID=1633335 RepID=A0A919CR37_9PROT|nr:OmpA family protein [Thalassobaculum fulvum]GHD57521.1 membrane protein [Thalassobaculum fulvum]